MFLARLNKVYMKPEDDKGAGGGASDRGDEVAAAAAAAAAAETAAAAAAAAQAETDAAALLAKQGEQGDKEGEQGRDANGKFAKKDAPTIPKERFDEAVLRERQARESAERRAEEAEAQLRRDSEGEEFKKREEAIETMEKKHSKLLLDGEHEKAAEMMKNIRHAERELTEARSEARANNATTRAVEEVRMGLVIEKLEITYPEFNPDSEEFNQKLVNLVLGEQRRLMATERLTPSAALDRAAKETMELFKPAKVDKKDEKPGLAAAASATDRKVEQVKKNLEAAAKQPASMKDVGLNSDKGGAKGDADTTLMTVEEWGALPEATKAQMRGDFA